MPLHRQRRSSRGFNQAELIARDSPCASCANCRWNSRRTLLKRTRFTESQTGFTREQRRENLRGAFAVSDPAQVRGRSILLVDDVLTTGATADECSRILLRAGAKQVLVVTVARAVSLDGVAAATKTCSVPEIVCTGDGFHLEDYGDERTYHGGKVREITGAIRRAGGSHGTYAAASAGAGAERVVRAD